MSTFRADDSDQFGCGILGTGSPSQFTHTQDGVPEVVNSIGVLGVAGTPAGISSFTGTGANVGDGLVGGRSGSDLNFSAAVAGFLTSDTSLTVAFGLFGGRDPVFSQVVAVYGESAVNGVFGRSTSSSTQDNAVYGQNEGPGHGVSGVSKGTNSSGFVAGEDPTFKEHVGVYGQSDQQGVMGLSTSDAGTGVYGGNTSLTGHGVGVRGETFGGVGVQGQSFGPKGMAGNFIGNVTVQGDLSVTGDVVLVNRDLCERFAVTSSADSEPGMVMVMGNDGLLTACSSAYDRSVVGVISGAGTLRPAITLGHQQHPGPDVPIALVGTAYCMADAEQEEIRIGDLLTSAQTRGHAMKVTDWPRSPGTVIGKALAPLKGGRGLIPIVISLQ